MKDDIEYIESRLQEEVTPPHQVQVRMSAPRGLLPGRNMFVRSVLKQYTLDFYDEDNEGLGYYYIVQYTLTPNVFEKHDVPVVLNTLISDLEALTNKW